MAQGCARCQLTCKKMQVFGAWRRCVSSRDLQRALSAKADEVNTVLKSLLQRQDACLGRPAAAVETFARTLLVHTPAQRL